jgi:glycosyltransferase involved in cell wall biosynthesis
LGKFRVAIVIPAYNEEDTIKQVIKSVEKYGDVIVVNDASSDTTKEEALKSGSIVVNHIINLGYDQSLNSGFIEADKRDYNAIITFDADGQHSSKMLEKYIYYLKNEKDLVLGVRPKQSSIVEWLFMKCAYYRFKWKDPLCGMKGYSMKLYRKQGYFDSYKSIGTELSIYGLLSKCSYVQLNIDITERKDRSRFYSIFASNLNVIKSLIKFCRI